MSSLYLYELNCQVEIYNNNSGAPWVHKVRASRVPQLTKLCYPSIQEILVVT